MSQALRVAVLGYGLAGRVFHCPFVSAIPGLRLHAIMQRHGDEASETYPQARILRSPEEIFADRELDLVIVATPNETHESLAEAALRAGKHVVVDKPVAPTPAAISHLAGLAASAGKLLIPFHNRRWDGDFLTVQQVLQGGELGRLVKGVSQWDRFRPIPRAGTWKEAAGEGNGLLQDLGPHLLDQALTLFGTPRRLTASVRRERDHSAVEDAFDIALEFPLATGHTLRYECRATTVAAEAAPRFKLDGTGGSFTKHGLDPQEPHLVADGRHPPQLGSSVPWIEDPEACWGTLTLAPDPHRPAELSRSHLPTLPGDYRHFYAGVRDALLGVAPPPVEARDAWRVARLVELARTSSREGRTVEVSFEGEPPAAAGTQR